MGKTTVSTTVPIEIYNLVKEKKLRWNELILAGLEMKSRAENNVTLLERLKETEDNNLKMAEKLRTLSLRIYDLEAKK